MTSQIWSTSDICLIFGNVVYFSDSKVLLHFLLIFITFTVKKLLHLRLAFYYIYGWLLLHLRLVLHLLALLNLTVIQFLSRVQATGKSQLAELWYQQTTYLFQDPWTTGNLQLLVSL